MSDDANPDGTFNLGESRNAGQQEVVGNEQTSPTAKKRKAPELALEFNDSDVLQVAASGDFKRLMGVAKSEPLATGILAQIGSLGSHGNRIDQMASNVNPKTLFQE